MQNIDTNALLKEGKLGALLVTNPINIFYLTGFKGVSETEREALLIIKKPKSILITAKLYQTEARRVASDNLSVNIAAERDEYENFIKESLKGVKRLGFEPHDLKFAEHKKFRKYQKGIKLVPTKNLVENLRITKSNDEIANIKHAQLITQKVFNLTLPTIKIGQTELEIAEKIKTLTRHFTHQGQAFEPIIASGPNSALPHHVTSKRKIKKGDALLFDFGAKYKNYCADFSRTIFIGKASDTERNIYHLVYKSQQDAIRTVKPNIKAKTVFETVHKVFKKEKVDSHFFHSLGHGIGLEVHEGPSLSNKSKDKLQKGMVFSIEPGLYFPWGGVRIEDLVLMDGNKAKIIGKASSFLELAI